MAHSAGREESEEGGVAGTGVAGTSSNVDSGNFTVATEDTANEPEVGSMWSRIRRESRLLQPRRSRTNSRVVRNIFIAS